MRPSAASTLINLITLSRILLFSLLFYLYRLRGKRNYVLTFVVQIKKLDGSRMVLCYFFKIVFYFFR